MLCVRQSASEKLGCAARCTNWQFGKTQHKAGKGIQVVEIGTKWSSQSKMLLGYVMGPIV